MDSYSLIIRPSVHKDLRKLPASTVHRVIERIERLASEPLPRQALKMSGAERVYRIRVGDYRIIYELDHEAKSIMILHVRHRREAYRDL